MSTLMKTCFLNAEIGEGILLQHFVDVSEHEERLQGSG